MMVYEECRQIIVCLHYECTEFFFERLNYFQYDGCWLVSPINLVIVQLGRNKFAHVSVVYMLGEEAA